MLALSLSQGNSQNSELSLGVNLNANLALISSLLNACAAATASEV